MKKIIKYLALALFISFKVLAQESPKEEDFYKIMTLPVPEGVLLEVGGVCMMPTGSLAIATRRGDIWIVENPTARTPFFKKFASGLHEILGIVYQNGSFFCAQRGELTKISDNNGDGKAETFETVHSWDISGHYHEYSFGPKIAPDGNFFVSGNVAFGNQEWWRGEARTKTRGTVFKVSPDGKYMPWAAGMRSPAGLGMIDDELFYTDNQGDWMGSGGMWHVKKGAFVGHPASLKWITPEHPVKLTEAQFFAERDNKQVRKEGSKDFLKPENKVDEPNVPLYTLKEKYSAVQPPAVWLPHGILGISNSEIIKDQTKGGFGVFADQVFVGDQGQSKIMRVFLEKVNGEYQGAAWDFRSGFQSGVMRMVFASDGSMFVGETNRGWGSAGDANQGLQRLIWNGKVPFEMLSCSATPDGFEIKFTQPIDKKTALDINSYDASSFIYKHQAVYGSPPVERQDLDMKGITVSEDGKTIKLVINNLRKYFVHELNLTGIRSAENSYSLVHPTVYYTLNAIPDGPKTAATSMVAFNKKLKKESVEKVEKELVSPDGKGKQSTSTDAKNAGVKTAPISFTSIKPLLTKHTCLACHAEDKKVIGPGFKEIAKRKYTPEQIVELIYKPKPENWPTYSTPMAAMPQVPKKDALLIGKYISGLK
jgi:cytochrome c551/c552